MEVRAGALLVPLVSCVLLVLVLAPAADAGCWTRCCTGRNNTCFAKVHDHHRRYKLMQQQQQASNSYAQQSKVNNKTPLGGKKGVPSRCYCDESCLYSGDCCHDYNYYCRPVNCTLGTWGAWGRCSKDCGPGIQTRSRPVLRQARNGGEKCGEREQKMRCEGQRCKYARHVYGMERKETAKIIPAKYGEWRKNKRYNPYKDIRRNLFNHYETNSIIKRPAYCAHFEVTHSMKSCKPTSFNPWMRTLKRGSLVCVECQPLAMKRSLGARCQGHGVRGQKTAWNAIMVPGCNGKWRMLSEHAQCSCNPKHLNSYILV